MLFFRLRVYGRENVPKKGAFILVGNHQSFLDPIFCGVPLKRRLSYVARDSLFRPLVFCRRQKRGFFGWAISSVGTIPVRRGKANLSAMKKVLGRLKAGKGVCLFPEGTRSSDGKIASLRGGFGLLCRRGEAPIVPVVVDGAFECWPRHREIFSPGSISVCYGKAKTFEQIKNMSDSQLAEFLTDTLRQMQNDCRMKHGKEPYDY